MYHLLLSFWRIHNSYIKLKPNRDPNKKKQISRFKINRGGKQIVALKKSGTTCHVYQRKDQRVNGLLRKQVKCGA